MSKYNGILSENWKGPVQKICEQEIEKERIKNSKKYQKYLAENSWYEKKRLKEQEEKNNE